MNNKRRKPTVFHHETDRRSIQTSSAWRIGIRSSKALCLLAVLLSGLVLGLHLHAQATSGTILGWVLDSSGAAIPGADVTITNVGTSEVKTIQTDGTGNYQVLYLIPGKYQVEIKKDGFDQFRHSVFALQVDQKARVDATLKVGSTTQTVEVTSEVPLLKTASSETGEVIETQQITTLPLNTRNFSQLLDLSTGTSPNKGGQGSSVSADHPEGVSATNVNGLPSDGNNWQLDGVSNNEAFFSVLTVNPSIDAIQEFKSTTSNYSAEFGRAGGANVQISIKSGANQFHGVAFEFLRNSALDANDYFSKQSGSAIPAFKQNQFGGNVGGPIRRDKTFFFVDYEGFRNSLEETEIMSVPTLLQRQGKFTETDPLTGAAQPTIYNPDTHVAYQDNTLPSIDTVAANILKLLPSPNLTGSGGAVLLANNYFGKNSETHVTDQGDIRVDHRVSNNNQAFARYSNLDTTLSQPPFLGTKAGGDPYLAAVSHSLNQNAVVSDVHTFSPRLVNEFRFGINSVKLNWASYDSNTTTSADVGIPGINDFCSFCGGLARIAISGMSTFGHTPYAPTRRHTTAFEWIDNVTMIRGKNTIKVGVDISKIRASLFQTSNPVGEFDFDANLTSNEGTGGIGLASFETGNVAKGSRESMTGYPHYFTNQLFFFGQDDIRLTDKLTVNAGLRYEIFTAATAEKNQQANFDLATGDLLYACIATSCTGGVKTDYGNVEPRVGFAYSVDPKTVVRAAFGISAFTPGSGGQLGTLGSNEPWDEAQEVTPATIYTPGVTLEQGLPALSALEARPGASAGHYIATGAGIMWLNPNLRQTRADQWSLDVQRTLPSNLLLDVAYVGNAVSGLYLSLPGNYAELDSTSTLSIQERRPYYSTNPDLNEFNKRTNVGHTDYHSLQAKLEKRYSNGLSFLAAYTYSKTLQRGPDYVNPDEYMQKDVSGQDLTQRFVLSYSYELPVGRRKLIGKKFNTFEETALGGWQIQGITVLRTGFAFTPGISSQLDNGRGNIPNRTGSGKLSNPTIEKWFDYTAFTQPGDHYGNAGYNILRGPGGKNSDMSLFKDIHFTDARYLQFRAEFFNVFNNVQFGNPNATIDNSGVGTITSLASGSIPRQIQFALKLHF